MKRRDALHAAAADAHGRLRAVSRLQGPPIGVFDEMIAGHALALGAVVVTNHTRHFARVPGLVTENWLPPAAGH
jgi:tRNA(fMet)-specific endonuclease VapC